MIFVIIIPIILLIYQTNLFATISASAYSPTFGKQEIQDPLLDSVNMKTKQLTTLPASYSTDLLAVDYYSDGKILNAVFWLHFPFNMRPTNYKAVHYGMLVDSDFDKTTGYYGVDYQFEIGWDNQNQTWNKKLEQWSPNGDERTLNITSNYGGFFEKEKNYVLLSLDLGSLLYPTKYKVTFYADVLDKNDTSIVDSTRWVAIPPLQLTIATSPTNLSLTPGEQKTVELRLNSTKGYEPFVNLSAAAPSNSLQVSFKKGFDKLKIPTYGIATTPVTISATNNASVAPYALTFFANSSFPPEQLITAKSRISSTRSFIPGAIEKSENIFSQSTMAITIQDPIPPLENFVKTWITPVTGIWTFLAGVATVLTPFVIRLYNKKARKSDVKTD
jgi:hypothetical protein